MAQRGRGAAAGARPAVRQAARSAAGRREGARDGSAGANGRRSGLDLAAIRARLRAIIDPAVTDAGLDLDDLVVTPAGRRLVVRVTVDGDDGVNHDELTDISREISARLDAAEESGGEFTAESYTLEVSSPGVDRPLILPRHWRRNIGRLVTVKADGRTLTARIKDVDETGVTLDADGKVVIAAFGQLGPGRIQVEFTRLTELADDDLGELVDDGDLDDEDDDHEDDDHEDEDDDQDDDHEQDDDIDLDEPQLKEDGA